VNIYVLFDGVVNEPYILSAVIYWFTETILMWLPLLTDPIVATGVFLFITFLFSLTGFFIWCKMKNTMFKEINGNIGAKLAKQLN